MEVKTSWSLLTTLTISVPIPEVAMAEEGSGRARTEKDEVKAGHGAALG